MNAAESISEEQALFVEMLVNGLALPVAIAEMDLTGGILNAWLASPRFAYLVKITQGELDQVERKLIDIELTLARRSGAP